MSRFPFVLSKDLDQWAQDRLLVVMLDQTDLTGVCAGIQEKKVSQLPCLHAELRAQDARDRGGGQACQIGAGGGWPGRAEVLDTHQTADHSMSGN